MPNGQPEGGAAGGNPAQVAAEASAAAAQAMAEALSALRLKSTPTVRLSKFYGRPQKPGDLTVAEWIDEFEVYCRQLGLEDLEKATALLDNLGGAAKEEALCADDLVRQDPDKLKELIRKRFGPAENLVSLSRILSARTQLESESLADFSRALMRIHSRMEKAATTQADKTALLRLKDLNLKGQFKRGVHSKDVVKDLERMEIREPDQTFASVREEILQLYPELETPRKTVRSVHAVEVESQDSTPTGTDFSCNEAGLNVSRVTKSENPKRENDPSFQALLDRQQKTNDRLDQLIGLLAQSQAAAAPTYLPNPQPTGYQACNYQAMPPNRGPYWGYRGNNQGKRGACFRCGVVGHFKRECPLLGTAGSNSVDTGNQNSVNQPTSGSIGKGQMASEASSIHSKS